MVHPLSFHPPPPDMRVSFSEIGEEVQAGLVGPWDKCTMHIYGDISIHFIIQRVEGL